MLWNAFLALLHSYHGSFTAVIIGFEMEQYGVFESDGVVTLVISVMEGTIRTPITIALSTINGSALGKFTVPTGVKSKTGSSSIKLTQS